MWRPVVGVLCLAACTVSNPDYEPPVVDPYHHPPDAGAASREAAPPEAAPDLAAAPPPDAGLRDQAPRPPDLGPLCAAGETAFEGHCYRSIAGLPLPYQAARKLCQAQKADVAALGSAEENGFAYSLLDPTTQAAWIGLRRSGPGGKTFSWETGEALVFSDWASGEPNNSLGVEDCAVIWGPGLLMPSLQGHWNDAPCEVPRSAVICERKP